MKWPLHVTIPLVGGGSAILFDSWDGGYSGVWTNGPAVLMLWTEGEWSESGEALWDEAWSGGADLLPEGAEP